MIDQPVVAAWPLAQIGVHQNATSWQSNCSLSRNSTAANTRPSSVPTAAASQHLAVASPAGLSGEQ
jgi:hypothetical protein